MSVVLADPAGFVVDWDWQRGLTVWTLAGRRFESHFAAKVIEHQLPDRPASERRARREARRWWRVQGHSQALDRATLARREGRWLVARVRSFGYREDTMKVIVYGDFNCPYSYLASQRADRLAHAGMTEIDWRAVEHDRKLAMTGTPAEADRAMWDRELAEVAALALPGEDAPAAPPPVISNTHAAVGAYAEAVSDGIAGKLRRRLFRAIWAQKRHLSSAYEVRRLTTGLMWRPEDITDRLASPDIPGLLDRDPDLARIVRRSGGTIAPDGGPLTTAGWLRIRQWRQEWLALPSQVIPAVIGPDQIVRSGIDGLHYLADLTDAAVVAASQFPDPQAGPHAGRLPTRTA